MFLSRRGVEQPGQLFRFDLDQTPGNNQRVMLPHPEIIEASQVGHVLLVDDGKVKLRVSATGPGYLDCVVEVAGKIKDKKASNTHTHTERERERMNWKVTLLVLSNTKESLLLLAIL